MQNRVGFGFFPKAESQVLLKEKENKKCTYAQKIFKTLLEPFFAEILKKIPFIEKDQNMAE